MEFTPDDFKRMMFNVYEADLKKSFVVQFPEMNLYSSEFTKRLPQPLENNRIIKYVAYVYDKNSPYRIKYKDITQRKVRAMIDCGYGLNPETRRFDKEVEDILKGKNPDVADMIIAFVKLHHDVKYSHVVILETLYYQIMKEVQLGQSTKIVDLEKTKIAYEQAINDVLESDQDRGLHAALYKAINSDKLRLAPEDIAQDIRDNGRVTLFEGVDDEEDEYKQEEEYEF
jgi:hypothetical protein